MRLKYLQSAIWLGFGFAALSACSEKPAIAAPAPAQQASELAQLDYVAMLTRTNSAEICRAEMKPRMDEELGTDFLSETYVRLGCECFRDLILYSAQQTTPDRPVLHNAMVQIATNREVIPYILNEDRYPGAREAFVAYMETHAKETLGFDAEELAAATSKIGAFSETFNSETELMLTLSTQVPSCAASIEAVQQRFPEWDPLTGHEGAEAMLDAQRAKHAQHSEWPSRLK